MGIVPISLGTRSNPSRHAKQAGNARLINCFAEEIGEEGKTPWVITACAGLSEFGTALGGGIRAMLEADGNLYVVAGQFVYKIGRYGEQTQIGSIQTATNPVYMRRNRASPTQIAIVSDGYYYVITNDSIAQIEDVDLPPPTSLAYLDGYGVLPGINRYMITSVDDFTAIDGLDEGTAEADPDPIVRAHELGREVYFFGTRTTEAHQNTGDADFPFQRSQVIEVGLAAADSVCPVDLENGRALVFVAHDHTVRMMAGYEAVVVSNGEIADLIRLRAEAGTIQDLRATSWSWGGRSFYCLSCPDWTRVLDTKTRYWHERKSYLADNWRIGVVVPFAGKLIAGDRITGQLYEMRDEIYDEAGEALVAEVIFPTVHMFPYGGVVNAVFPNIVTGVGLNTAAAQNLDPVALFDWSKDGGDSFGSARTIKLHRQGQTGRRIQPLTRLGRFGQKGITFRTRISADVKKVMFSTFTADIEQLAS
jgi:hypothetical protein